MNLPAQQAPRKADNWVSVPGFPHRPGPEPAVGPGPDGSARMARAIRDLRERLGPPMLPQQLGDILVARGALTPENLALALSEQARTGGRLGEILVARGDVDRLDVFRALSDAWGMQQYVV